MDAEGGVRQAPESVVGACKSWRSRPRGMMLAGAVLDATANLPDCKSRAIRAVERSMQLAKSEGRAYTVNETTVTSSDTPATFIAIVSSVCLPDTVDPRGPKAR